MTRASAHAGEIGEAESGRAPLNGAKHGLAASASGGVETLRTGRALEGTPDGYQLTSRPAGARPARDVASGASLYRNAQSPVPLTTEIQQLSHVRAGMRYDGDAATLGHTTRTRAHARLPGSSTRAWVDRQATSSCAARARAQPFPTSPLMGVRWGRPIHLAGLASRYDRIGPLRGSDVDGAINRYGSLRYTTLAYIEIHSDIRFNSVTLVTGLSLYFITFVSRVSDAL